MTLTKINSLIINYKKKGGFIVSLLAKYYSLEYCFFLINIYFLISSFNIRFFLFSYYPLMTRIQIWQVNPVDSDFFLFLIYFFQFQPLILNIWLRIKFYDLFYLLLIRLSWSHYSRIVLNEITWVDSGCFLCLLFN
jgi:hypothetical protein